MSKSIPRMILKTYSLYVLGLDIIQFVLYTLYSIFMALVHTFRPPKQKSIKEKVSLVVGASRGIGKEIAIELGKIGAKVICIDLNSVENESTVKCVRVNGGKAYAFTCDVTNKEQVLNVIKTVEKQIGAISLLFHCCGVPSPRSYASIELPIKTTLDVSVVSHFWLLEAILPGMKKRKSGHIVLLTSVAGISGIDVQIPVGVSQFAIQGLFESLVENLRIEKFQDKINVSLAHVYPFIVSEDLSHDISLRIPNFFGTIDAHLAAKRIIDGVLRNQVEISIPKNVLYLGHVMRLLPRKSTAKFREFFDTGVDFG